MGEPALNLHPGCAGDAPQTTRTCGGCLSLPIDDDSMMPTLRLGDEVLVQTCSDALSTGLYALQFDSGIRVRRISKSPDTGLLSVAADNPAWPSFHRIDPARLTIIGRVSWMGRTL